MFELGPPFTDPAASDIEVVPLTGALVVGGAQGPTPLTRRLIRQLADGPCALAEALSVAWPKTRCTMALSILVRKL